MTQFSANLGFLWSDLSLPDAIRAAKAAGFDAVECHWPFEVPAEDVKAALDETGLIMLGLNTIRGDVASGDNGTAAIPGREQEARAAIDQALDYAARIGTPNVHVMAGFAGGPKAHATFISNLTYACEQALKHGITILIEPLNHYDAPNYFLATSEQAKAIILEVGAPNLKLMFDCYHLQIMEGDLVRRLEKMLPLTGHIQFASVPDRGTPDHGEVNYNFIFEMTEKLGWTAPLGAEYKPGNTPTDQTLGWLKK
ncbi:hydroxypyruvate isomerase [Cohaesibacter sp. ES.047]|uniref:hydroxypyruvate isomerase family protein n=1 Tax=Cohaesibacter sp. ES.047 TaxID=1798205 RepID=UPI000BB80BE1|nr:TIM barrel protein [Cohaesibacter sp. ES.047]SNY91623.1 hydroxypyruvate isomerase [Cohaesibacter sp. ES.047]